MGHRELSIKGGSSDSGATLHRLPSYGSQEHETVKAVKFQIQLARGVAVVLFLCLLTVLSLWQPPARSGSLSAHVAAVQQIEEKLERQRAYNDVLAPRVMKRILKASQASEK